MSAFEVTITPTRLKNKKRLESREPTEVVMAPFSAKAIVQFEDVPVAKTAKRVLQIVNPSESCIEVRVTKSIDPEQNVTISWTEMTVPGESVVEMEIVWSPQIDVISKETLELTDNRNFRKDVMIILKTKSSKSVKNVRKFPTVSSAMGISTHVKTLRLKSPKGAGKTSKSMVHMQQRKRLTKNDKSQKSAVENKIPWKDVVQVSASRPVRKEYIHPESISPLTEQNINMKERCCCTHGQHDSPKTSSHLKENISPITPGNVLNLIENLNFTPLSKTSRNVEVNLEALASWPTPVAHVQEAEKVEHKNLRGMWPRRLTCMELEAGGFTIPELRVEECLEDTKTSSAAVLNDKTFDVKRTEELSISMELLDRSLNERLPCSEMALNRTTTILSTPLTRQLEVIREEDVSIATDAECKETCENEDLKRDIKLVGTPLRKYSESMKDLSLKSSQTKIATQGSLPNLNEMESIRSIEQNRYFYKMNQIKCGTGITEETRDKPDSPNDSLNTSNSSQISLILHADFFNQKGILAQSSRFNLNEVGATNDCGKKANEKQTAPQKLDSPQKLPFNSQKRKSWEISFSDSHSNDSIASVCSSTSSAVRQGNTKVSPPKRKRVESDLSFLRPSPRNASSAGGAKNWSQIQPKKLKLSRTLSLIKKPITPRKVKEEPRTRLYDSDLYMQCCINPDPFAATTTCDPFLASTMYLDEHAVDRHQNDFKKWLNALVSIPTELDTDCNAQVDVGKLFNMVRHKELVLAPTKEQQSMHYLTQFRLESLRRAAVQLFLSEEMRVPCSKVAVYVNKAAIRIRSDRNLHLDVVMQRYILELLLCFNPLWLRLGMEVVYGEKIHLQSNRDVVGLTSFILNRLFRDKFLEQKYSKAYTLSDEYSEHIKKFTLQKMLHLLLFLDKAKSHRIIKHNPCLFVKKSPHKEIREILLKFSSEMLANVGDITRELKRLGYVLEHKQTFLDEFDYAFKNLAVDLRDGVRLSRVMEIILLRDDLNRQLRVPAISRLQRVFNVNLGLRALSEADFQLKGDITAADIVDGHREKTLSLLWQIIYKFRSPKFHAAAKVLQKWWRQSWLRVAIQRRIRHKVELRRTAAATCIQAAFRGHVTRKFAQVYKEERSQAATVLQKYTRRHLAQKGLARAMSAVLRIQRWYRAQKQGFHCRQQYLDMCTSTVFIQRSWRRRLLSKKLFAAAAVFSSLREQQRKAAAEIICRHWQSFHATKEAREHFLLLRQSALVLQRRFRAKLKLEKQLLAYKCLREAAIAVQRRFRAIKLMKQHRAEFHQLRMRTVQLQQRFRATKEMRLQRAAYLTQRQAALCIQRRLRATRSMAVQRAEYTKLHAAACTLQSRYRASRAMKTQLESYQRVKRSIVCIQRKWLATRLARRVRVQFLSLQYHALVVQQKFLATRTMRKERAYFLQLRVTAVCMQRRFRAKLEMRRVRVHFLRTRLAAIVLQRRFRAYKQMRFFRAKFRGIRTAVVCLQQHARGYLLMKHERGRFLELRRAAVQLQRAFRARLSMQAARAEYARLRSAVLCVQRRYRAKRQMRQQMQEYTRQRRLLFAMQRRVRAKILMRQLRQDYTVMRGAIMKVQRRYRATVLMRRARAAFLEKRSSVVKLQRRFRARLVMKRERAEFQLKREAASRIQRWFRAILLMREQRYKYQEQRAVALVLQRRFRARREMLKMRSQYLLIRSLIICIQRRFRAHRAMLSTRSCFLQLKGAAVQLQQRYRGLVAMRHERAHFQLLRLSAVHFQTHARGYLARRRLQALLTPEMVDFLRCRKAAKVIQSFWRGYRVRRKFQNMKILLIRKNIAMLKKTSTAVNTIRFKVQNAVHQLRGRYNVSEALNVLMQLERLSRTVPHLLMSQSDFISNFCYGIMAQAIRSEVDKKMIEHSSRIILNLARYNSNTANTFREGGLVTIAQMLLRWCDKDCDIFNILCTLIWIFAHCPYKREIIRKFMTTTEAIYFVRETKKLVARKEKMKQNVRNPTASQRGGTLSQKTFSSRALPSLEPDYGVICNKPYTFISSVYAFDTILYKLGIELF